ncbi:DUF2087 domain-containing protein [Longispora albida]|uniref:DUF2087 domain-containing protein n=1 Tax=Longispora albida TaxID=203523 RepID=UPI00058BE5E2|nr:DUF2087 domain-containing protein [Longispora albida]
MTPEAVCGLLAEPDRLKVYAAIVLGAGTPSEIVAGSGLAPAAMVKAIKRLEQGGLVSAVDGRYVAAPEAIKGAIREAAANRQPEAPLHPDPKVDAVLRSFVKDGRIRRLPTVRAKLKLVLEHVALSFEPGVRYPEREVNEILRAWYPDDYAQLRRDMVDNLFLTRDAGVYWRSGGLVDVH